MTANLRTASCRLFLPFGDIVDRLTIHELYRQKAPESYDEAGHEMYRLAFEEDERLPSDVKREFRRRLLEINGTMWPLEARLRRLDSGAVEEVGLICLELRSLNERRNRIKDECSRSAAIMSAEFAYA